MTDPMPRQDVELPPRMPEAGIIAELRAQARADAQAAVALAYEMAGLAVANVEIGFHDGISGDWHPMAGPSIISAACATIRALAPADGLAAVEALRQERDRFEAALSRACLVGGTTYLVERAERAEAERDRLAAALAERDRLRADAQAAVALVVQKAADVVSRLIVEQTFGQNGDVPLGDALHRIRALAPADGLAAVEALRAEIADLKMNMDADLRTMVREGQQLRTLATELAAAQQREAGLVAAMEIIAKQKRTDELDTEHDVEMADFEGGYDAAINVARAALATQEAKNG